MTGSNHLVAIFGLQDVSSFGPCHSPLGEASDRERLAGGDVDQLVAGLGPLPQLLVRPCERPQLLPGAKAMQGPDKAKLMGRGWTPTCQHQLEGQCLSEHSLEAKRTPKYQL